MALDKSNELQSISRLIIIPALFSVLVWTAPKAAPIVSSRINMAKTKVSDIAQNESPFSAHREMNLVPTSLSDIYKMGYISAQFERIDEVNNENNEVNKLLEDVKKILQLDAGVSISVDQATIGVEEAIKLKDSEKSYVEKIKGAFTFVGVLSFLSLAGIMVTLLPTLTYLWKELRLGDLLSMIVTLIRKFEELFQPLIEILLFAIPLVLYYTSLDLHRGGGASAQVAALSAALSGLVYIFYVTPKHPFNGSDNQYMTLSFLWGASFLIPMAVHTSSKLVGFFAIAAIYGALGFLALPVPSGWSFGFKDEKAMDRSMIVSLIIIGTSIIARTYLKTIIPQNIQCTFETGAAIFGMVAFGIAGLIKSMELCRHGPWYSGIANPRALIYPLSWVLIASIGYITSYRSLGNTSVVFIVLWMSQFYWRFSGVGAVSIFLASLMVYVGTLSMKMYPEFVESIFRIEEHY